MRPQLIQLLLVLFLLSYVQTQSNLHRHESWNAVNSAIHVDQDQNTKNSEESLSSSSNSTFHFI